MSKHVGSSLNDFLSEEGLLEHTEEVANKRIYDHDKMIVFIGNLKSIAQQAIFDFVTSSCGRDDMLEGLAAKFIEDILLIPADKYLAVTPNSGDHVMCMGIDFTDLFGENAGRLAAKFALLQLSQQNPEFGKFLTENPQYDQHNQSADTQD